MRTKQMRPHAIALASDRKTLALDRQMLTSWAVTAAAVILVMLLHALGAFAQEANQKTYPSADAAVEALATATRTQDVPALQAILGVDRDVLGADDDATSRRDRETFTQKYDQMHRVVQEPDGSTVLYIGAENWPFPFPIAHKGDVWFFDANAGIQELLYRTIGENELTAIALCEQLVSAADAAGDQVTASSVAVSSSGTDGGAATVSKATTTNLDAAKDGKMRAHARHVRALAQNAKGRTPRARPNAFYGYYFEVIDPAAADAKSGEAFAFVAYPVDYRSSGVMTFVVTQDGAVYEKDLGTATPSLARKITPRAPRTGWSRSSDQ